MRQSGVGFEFFVHLLEIQSGRFIRFSISLNRGSPRKSSSAGSLALKLAVAAFSPATGQAFWLASALSLTQSKAATSRRTPKLTAAIRRGALVQRNAGRSGDCPSADRW